MTDIKPDRLRQVWFPGAHADVGGGYPDDGLSYVALCWMIEEAANLGLRFEVNLVESYTATAASTGRIYDSRSGFGVFWRYQPRDAQLLMGPGNTPLVHESVITRMIHGNDGYAPISLPTSINVLPPNGPPVPFDEAVVTSALANVNLRSSRAMPYPERLNLQKLRRFLTEMKPLVKAANGQGRADRFALVLDTVWWRRFVYLVSLFLALVLAAYPLIWRYVTFQGITDGLDVAAGGPTAWLVGLVKGFLPAFAEPWLTAITEQPAEAVLIVVALVASLRVSTLLQHRIYDRARAAWSPRGQEAARPIDRLAVTGQRHALTKGILVFTALATAVGLFGDSNHLWLLGFFALLGFLCLVLRLYRVRVPSGTIDPAKPGFLLGLARKARQSAVAVNCYRFTAGTAAPAAFLGLSAIIVASLAHRGVFDILSAAGTYCPSTLQTQDEKIRSASALIYSSGICNPTGFNVVAGRRYRIRLNIGEAWFDKDIHTDVGGFAADSLRHYLSLPLKRWWRENWFQPIVRIGELGNYEHVLQASAPLPVARSSQCPPRMERRQSFWATIKDIPQPASKEFRQKQLACENNAGIQRSRMLISDITADATGEIFIYINDAILMWPGQTNVCYRNNSGTAWVTVTRIRGTPVLDSDAEIAGH